MLSQYSVCGGVWQLVEGNLPHSAILTLPPVRATLLASIAGSALTRDKENTTCI